MLVIKNPTRKKDTYVAKVACKEGRAVRVTFPYAKFVTRNGHILRIWVPDDSTIADVVSAYDEECLQAALTSNAEWFSNALDPEKIHGFFRKSINRNTMAILISDVKPPCIYHNRSIVESFDGIGDPSKVRLSVELEIQGLYFFSQKFGLRWLLKTIKIEDEPDEELEEPRDHKSDVEDEWERDIKTLDEGIQRDIEEYREKIRILEGLTTSVHGLLSKAKKEENCSLEWNATLSQLTDRMAKYYNGTIFICNKI